MKLFSVKESKTLKQLLACAVDQEAVLSLDSLHGFLFCLATIPEAVVPSEWLPCVFGEEMIEVEDEESGSRLLAPLFAAYNRMIAESDQGALVFPFDMGKLKTPDLERMRHWAYGFFIGTNLRPEVWGFPDDVELDPDTFVVEEDDEDQAEMAASMAVLMGVAFPDQIPEILNEPTVSPQKELARAKEQEAKFFVLLPQAIATFQEFARSYGEAQRLQRPMGKLLNLPVRREEKVGRNEACPCGSGKKYKKCCGVN